MFVKKFGEIPQKICSENKKSCQYSGNPSKYVLKIKNLVKVREIRNPSKYVLKI